MNAITTAWVLTVLGQAAAGQATGNPAAGAEVDPGVQVQSVWEFMVKGGPMMIPIGLCSLVALTVIVERLVSLRRRRIIPRDFLPGVSRYLGNGLEDREEALQYCRDDGSPIANVFAAGIKRLGGSVESIEKNVSEAGEREVFKLRKYLRSLSVIASIAPLLGLLGTIFGMITAFQTVALSGEALGKTELLAKGIYQALITTAAGLMVAIPVLIAYHWISAHIEHLVGEMDMMTVEFIEEYAHPQPEQQKEGPKLQAVEDDDEADESDGSSESAATA